MPGLRPFRHHPRDEKGSVRVTQVAGKQWGVIGHLQLRDLGIARQTVARWRRAGWLHPLIPGVDAVGHTSVPVEGWLLAALLHAGPGAALSHATATWWWGFIPKLPARIEVSSLTRARSLPQVFVHHPRTLEVVRHRLLPITAPAQTLVDYAKRATDAQVRQALSEADYRGRLDLGAIRAHTGPGRAGSARVRRALQRHEPQLARTRSGLERAFLRLCETNHIPMPEVNVRIGRTTVDALWREQRLVVEIDGNQGHKTRAQLERDRRRELHLRAAGFTVVRYTEDQLNHDPDLVVRDLRGMLRAESQRRFAA